MDVDILEIEAELTAPGGPFELVEADVFGQRVRVFKNTMGTLRDLLANSEAHGDSSVPAAESSPSGAT